MTTPESRLQTWLEWGRACPLVPVVAVANPEEAVGIAGAFAEAGVKLVEIVLRLPGAMQAVAAVVKAYPQLVVGAGTVTRPEQLDELAAAGGRFAVSPGTTPELLAAMAASPLACLPGIATPSEAMRVRDAGFHAVKVFPASVVGGAAFIRALAPVLGEMHFCPTGGVSCESLPTFLAAPRVFAFGASWPCNRDLIESRNWTEVTRRCRVMLDLANANQPTA